jgi:hypothetical protein
MLNLLQYQYIRVLVLGCALLCLARTGAAQVLSTPPPADSRFQGVTENWDSPALGASNLKAVRPLAGFVDTTHTGYTVELLQLQWRTGDPLDLYVMKPKGVTKPPVILYLYGYPTDTDIFKNEVYQQVVTKDGFAAVGFVSALTGHRYHDRPMKQWFLSEFQESLATSAHDVQMVLNYLATRTDLDLDRVGMFAQGSGASIAILASSADPRIKVLEALDPWGDWPTWLATSPFVPPDERADYVKPDFLNKVATLDPLTLLPKIQARKFRLDDELFDRNTPKPIQDKLRAAVTPGATVEIYKSMDDFKAAFEDGKNLKWIQHELQSLAEPPTAPLSR